MKGIMSIRSVTPKRVGGFLPKLELKEKILSTIEDILAPMLDVGDASPPDVLSAYSKDVLASWYVGNAPKGLVLGNNTCCHGAGVQVTTYKVYTMEKAAAYSPENFRTRYGHYPRVYATEKGRTTQVAVMQGNRREGLGRMGGFNGWDATRDLFGFALASFRHNFQALLGAFGDRPKLPCREEWHLPNLILSEQVREIEERYGCKIVEPPIAVPPASYKFGFVTPAPAMVLAVGTNCPKDTRAILEVWDSNKSDFADPMEVTFPQGENETVMVVQAPIGGFVQSGFLNINPIDSEMSIAYIDVLFPPV